MYCLASEDDSQWHTPNVKVLYKWAIVAQEKISFPWLREDDTVNDFVFITTVSLAFRQKKERLPFPVVAKLTVVHSEETNVYRKGNRLIL